VSLSPDRRFWCSPSETASNKSQRANRSSTVPTAGRRLHIRNSRRFAIYLTLRSVLTYPIRTGASSWRSRFEGCEQARELREKGDEDLGLSGRQLRLKVRRAYLGGALSC
jgi:hypothetical protein